MLVHKHKHGKNWEIAVIKLQISNKHMLESLIVDCGGPDNFHILPINKHDLIPLATIVFYSRIFIWTRGRGAFTASGGPIAIATARGTREVINGKMGQMSTVYERVPLTRLFDWP